MTAPAAALGQGDIAFQLNLYEDDNIVRRGLHSSRRRWVEDALGAMRSSPRPVLEIGVGCGIFTRFIVAHGGAVTAVDINPTFVRGVADLDRVDAIVADATLPLPIGGHDVALCSEVLEHVPADRSRDMLRTIANALAPGGRLILTTPQRFSTVELMARLLRFAPLLKLARRLYGSADELGHVNLLTAGALGRQIAEAGFVVERRDRFGFYLPVIAEFGGAPGAALLRRAGEAIARVPGLRSLLWTQAYVLRKDVADA